MKWAFLFFLFLVASSTCAADSGSAFLRITSAVLHGEGPQAEVCLSFSEPINVREREKFLSALKLLKNGRVQKLSAQDLSLTQEALCVQGLEHREPYALTLRKIQSLSGKGLRRPYSTAFTVPDRKAALAFVSDFNLSILPRHVKRETEKKEWPSPQSGMAHVLRSVNIRQAHLTLYRIANRGDFADAWRQFTLINLSPAESLVFAREKGQQVFESDLVFQEKPNVEQTLVAPLPPDSTLAAGLYYLAAIPKAENQSKPGLFAGQWFLISDLRLSSLRLPEGLRVFAGDVAARSPAANVEIQVLSREGDLLGEARTGADGMTFLSLPEDKKTKAALLMGWGASGDADMVDIGRDSSLDLGPLPMRASIELDEKAYRSGGQALAALKLGRGQNLQESFLKLLHADGRFYSQQPVSLNESGSQWLKVSLPLAGTAENWILSWQTSRGVVLAEAPLLVAPRAGDAMIEMRRFGAQAIGIKTMDRAGRPLPFQDGTLSFSAEQPKIPKWDFYHFGVAPEEREGLLRKMSFLTGPDGVAHVTLPEDLLKNWDMLALEAFLPQEGAFASLTFPALRFSSLIGVRPLTEDGFFAENGMAHFEVVAVDRAGRRQARKNLFYLIFEEGRSFEWFPAEGHWDYKPLPLHRRVGGGSLSIAASGTSRIDWPVTTGQYVLEITDNEGTLLARQPFEAGRARPFSPREQSARLRFVAAPDELEENKKNVLRVSLDAAAFVAFDAFDGQERMVSYRFLTAGEHELILKPDKAWGDQVLLRAQALFADSPIPARASRVWGVRKPRHELTLQTSLPSRLLSGEEKEITVRAQPIQGRLPTQLSLAVKFAPQEEGGETVLRLGRASFDPAGRAKIKITSPPFEGTASLRFYAENKEQYGRFLSTLSLEKPLAVDGSFPSDMEVGDKREASLSITNHAAAEGLYHYKFQLPSGLAFIGQEPEGEKLLRRGESHTFSLNMTANKAGNDVVRFELTGPGGARFARQWPLFVYDEDSRLWEAISHFTEKEKSFSLQGIERDFSAALLSPIELPGVMKALQEMNLSAPYTTQELSLWLQAFSLWAPTLKSPFLMGEERGEERRAAFLRHLEMRQNEDGGFASVRAGEPSDMASTAASLLSLPSSEAPSFLQGVGWLEEKLQNTWFDEKEREERIFALEVLSRFGKARLSSLRYFAQTSRDKELSPSAAAALGLALVRGGDTEAAGEWTQAALARIVQEKEKGRALYYLAMNDKVPQETLESLLAVGDKNARSLDEAAVRLISFAVAAKRRGEWEALVADRKIKTSGVFALPLSRDKGAEEIKAGSQPLWVVEIKKAEAALPAKARVSLEREFRKLDGSQFDFDLSLMKGETYLLFMKGQGKTQGPLRLLLPRRDGYEISVPEDQTALRAYLPWLPSSMSFGYDAAVLPENVILTVSPTNGVWQVPFLIKASRVGTFSLPSAQVFSMKGKPLPLMQNALRFSVW